MFWLDEVVHPPTFYPSHRLSEWEACTLELRCSKPGCSGSSRRPIRLTLLERGDMTFEELLTRLRCPICRGHPAPVYLIAGQHRTFCYGGRPDWSLELVPPPRPA